MRIGLLLPSVLTAQSSLMHRIFAPLYPGVDLANGLVENGHEVFFYTASDVATKATVVGGNPVYTEKKLVYQQFIQREPLEQKYSTIEIMKRDFENALTMQAYKDAQEGKLDIIHSYHDFSAHYFDEVTGIPTVYTLHNPLPQEKDTIEYERFHAFASHNYISISMAQRRSIVSLHFIANIYHGIDNHLYDYQETPENALVFMGRLIPNKGVDIAIQVAKETGVPLHIAASSDVANTNDAYYKETIAPFLDGKTAMIDGFFHGKEKSAFLGKGKAFVFPLQWEEPFGLVIIEAMACGTPVIAYNRGSAAELIKDGVTGFIIDPDDTKRAGKGSWVIKKQGIEGIVEAVQRIGEIDRAACRKHVEEHFTVEKMVDKYEKLYASCVK